MGGNEHNKPAEEAAEQATVAEAVADVAEVVDRKRIELVHDKPAEDRERERETRDRAEDARIAKGKKKMRLVQLRRESAKKVPKLQKKRSEAELALQKAGKAQAKGLSESLPEFVTKIISGYAEGGLEKRAVITYGAVEVVDKVLQLSVNLVIVMKDDKMIGDEEYGHRSTRTHSEQSTDTLYVDPDEAIQTAWEAYEAAKKECEENNKLLMDVDEVLAEIEELGEAAEVTILEEGLSDERKSRVEKLEGMYDSMLGSDAARLLGAGEEG